MSESEGEYKVQGSGHAGGLKGISPGGGGDFYSVNQTLVRLRCPSLENSPLI